LSYILLHCLLTFLYLLAIFFFFTAPPPPEIYTLSLHDALPISLALLAELGLTYVVVDEPQGFKTSVPPVVAATSPALAMIRFHRSEEHTSELQSRSDLVCRLLLEKKKKIIINTYYRSLLSSPSS